MFEAPQLPNFSNKQTKKKQFDIAGVIKLEKKLESVASSVCLPIVTSTACREDVIQLIILRDLQPLASIEVNEKYKAKGHPNQKQKEAAVRPRRLVVL